MKVAVDRERCQVNGVCARHAPEVFRVGDDDQLYVLAEEPDDGQRRAVREAARRCPTRAITVSD